MLLVIHDKSTTSCSVLNTLYNHVFTMKGNVGNVHSVKTRVSKQK